VVDELRLWGVEVQDWRVRRKRLEPAKPTLLSMRGVSFPGTFQALPSTYYSSNRLTISGYGVTETEVFQKYFL
jgi:hypothetical protein